ncbi:MAG: 16S rRNA (guanine(966)-N(2))-methyltransferase RsmD [bacterium]
MRIIAGSAKGRILKSPSSGMRGKIRPLSEQVREALFNILRDKIDGARFLDLFSGTGAVGIEALSRGAKLCFFVEWDRKTSEIIRENLNITGFSEQAEIYVLPVRKALSILDSKKAEFDIIFIGAPYDDQALEEALKILANSNIVSANGVVIAEHRSKHEIAESFGQLKLVRSSKYGDTMLSFYKKDQ